MFKLVDLICNNEACTLEPYEDLLTNEELVNGVVCPLCGKPLEIDTTNKPRHGKHLSWATWRVDLGNS